MLESIHTYIHTCIHTCIQTNRYEYLRVYIHTHTNAYIHTYTHTTIPTQLQVSKVLRVEHRLQKEMNSDSSTKKTPLAPRIGTEVRTETARTENDAHNATNPATKNTGQMSQVGGSGQTGQTSMCQQEPETAGKESNSGGKNVEAAHGKDERNNIGVRDDVSGAKCDASGAKDNNASQDVHAQVKIVAVDMYICAYL